MRFSRFSVFFGFGCVLLSAARCSQAVDHDCWRQFGHDCGLPTDLSSFGSDSFEPWADFNEDTATDDESRFETLADAQRAMAVVVRSADGTSIFGSGTSRFAKVEYGPLAFDLLLPTSVVPMEVRVFYDGTAAHPEMLKELSQWTRTEAGYSASFVWSCPELGRHSLQFETRVGPNRIVSDPLMLEIVPPEKPEIVAVATSSFGPSPIKAGQIVSLYRDEITVKFAIPNNTPAMIMKMPGLEEIQGENAGDCCFKFQLHDSLSVGRHALQFARVVGENCTMTSEWSNPLWIDYEPREGLRSIRNERALIRHNLANQVASMSIEAYLPVAEKRIGTSPIDRQTRAPFTAVENTIQSTTRGTNPFPVGGNNLPSPDSTGSTPPVPIVAPNPGPSSGSEPKDNTAKATTAGSESPSTSPDRLKSTVPEASNSATPTVDPIEKNSVQPPSSGKKDDAVNPSEDPNTSSNSAISRRQRFVAKLVNDQLISTSVDLPPQELVESPAPSSIPDSIAETKSLHALAHVNQSIDMSDVEVKGCDLSSEACQLQNQLSSLEDSLENAEKVWRSHKVVSKTIFDQPAYFTRNSYGPAAQEDARPGLILVEGMTFQAYADGHWELRVPYIQPTMPAELHLQLQFKAADGRWKPLTLQPVCFQAGKACVASKSDDEEHGEVVRCDCHQDGTQPCFTLHGYSPILEREVGYFTDIRRRGSVTFGHGYDALRDRQSY
jgi:hypothetical protein